jgi:hypothetical protein
LDAVDDTDFVGIKQLGTQGSRHNRFSSADQDSKKGRACQIGGWHVLEYLKSIGRFFVSSDSMPKRKAPSKPVKLLTGGNPQIAKADGDAPVRAYIAAMPDWKRAVGERLDKLIVEAVPKVQKAVSGIPLSTELKAKGGL